MPSDDAIIPSWEEEVLNQKCQSIAPDRTDSLPYLDEMKSMITSVLRAKEFRSFLHRSSNPVCNHPRTQEEATRIYEEGLRDWEDCMHCTLLQICAIGDASISSWEEEVLNQKCNKRHSTWFGRLFAISWRKWYVLWDHVSASSESISILSTKLQ